MPATGIRISSHTRIPDPHGWDAVVAAAGAPVFYRSALLTSYAANPLQPTLDHRYLTVGSGDDPAAVMPLYLVPARDPFGTRNVAGPPWAVSHFWHCYDTRLPLRHAEKELVEPLWEAMRAQARAWGAAEFGFINMALDSPLTPLLESRARRVPRNHRFRMPLTAVGSFAEHLERLPARVRQDARRQLRLAARAGITGHVYRDPLPERIVRDACRLLKLTADRYNPGYYEQGPLADLLTNVGAPACVFTLEEAGHVVAASVSFLDGRTLHNWAIGVESEVRGTFSPYLVLLDLSVDYAVSQGCEVIELGRTNPAWKQRFGAEPVELVSWMCDSEDRREFS
ncbi:GNAT family N-acetyltransferase [Streptomyces griseofuscus]|uniref:GNAT family N-acetyltransferase n=1 Tax=Streptomyces griseofuscus TaxID=146922 RepID=A0A3R8QAH9_9ACTN|nr:MULTISPECIES: GNAT family N-acetyltransferase [Streptomyces]MBJ7004527.1 GNAT family N-acetyltransferase [Streptomyces sp. CRPSP2-6A1]MYQ94084.1 GNAT family N-acetyltransferase [Streptomyces sp. SID4946]MYR85789.1 GNAT family N-acetyltransferase [Streptomyces sp. SID685]RRQ76266.1 GNAT family N-acetyltransferase [Streptomyces griseofuscus]RRQ84534.1 GNAT family N-acetyltransferase [Streptomyces griseofuscus]